MGNYLTKVLASILAITLLFTLNAFGDEVIFNYDLERVPSDYYFYEGFGDDNVFYNIKENRWGIIRANGEVINLKGDYISYCDIVEGKYYNFYADHYRFLIENESGTTSFVYVSNNGIESIVDGYTFANPTMNENYLYIYLEDEVNERRTGIYNIITDTEVIPCSKYVSLNYANDSFIIAVSAHNGKYGAININDEEVVPFEYDNLEYINDNFVIAAHDGKYGVINIKYEQVLPYEFDEISFSWSREGYCKALKGQDVLLINTNDINHIIPFVYDDIFSIEDGFIRAQINWKQGIVDINSNEIVPFIYDYIEKKDGYFIVHSDGKAGVINKNGEEIMPLMFDEVIDIKDNKATVVILDEQENWKYGLYELNGDEIIPVIYDFIDYNASDKYMVISKDGYGNIIDKNTNEEVLPQKYSKVKYINDKYAAVGYGVKCVINFAGQQLTSCKYESIYTIKINNEELIACEYYGEDKFKNNIDYFRATSSGPSDWAVEEIKKAIESNLIPFELQVSYKSNIDREDFCKVMVAFISEKTGMKLEDMIINCGDFQFNDCFSAEVIACYQLGIVKGKGNDIFDPEGEITREEAAVMIVNLLKYLGFEESVPDEINLKDREEISPWSNDAADYVLQNNIMLGTGDNMFSPKSNITREQTYIIMFRMLNSLYNKL